MSDFSQSSAALSSDRPCAYGQPLGQARLREHNCDFVVDEELGFVPSGEGEHFLVQLRKDGQNTDWVADQLAQALGVTVSFSGRKDRHAITTQWVSFSWPIASADPALPEIEGVQWLQCLRHSRKLRSGSHQANHFCLRLRAVTASAAALETRLRQIADEGMPNYFGAQRFGHENLAAWQRVCEGRRVSRSKRSMLMSAARSALFNDWLAQRVQAGTLWSAQPGDWLMLRESQSGFAYDPQDPHSAEIAERLQTRQLRLAGTLPGRGARDAKRDADAEHPPEHPLEHPWVESLRRFGVDAARRPAWVWPLSLRWQWEDEVLCVQFGLQRGSFATVLLEQCLAVQDASTLSNQTGNRAGDQA